MKSQTQPHHPPTAPPTQPRWAWTLPLLVNLLISIGYAANVQTITNAVCSFPATNYYDFGTGIPSAENNRDVLERYDPIAVGDTFTFTLGPDDTTPCDKAWDWSGDFTVTRNGTSVAVGDAVAPGDTFVVTVGGSAGQTLVVGFIGGGSHALKFVVRVAQAPLTAPTNVTAVGGAAEAVVSWDAVTNATGYTVTTDPGGKTCTATSQTTCTVTGLAQGNYTFTVVATGSGDPSPNSAPSASTAVYVAPGAPTNVTAVTGDESATVTWSAPANDGGNPIYRYTVTSNPGGKTCTWSSGPLTCTVTGLTNGTPTTFTVTARNDAGIGIASGASNAITPVGEPTSVASLDVVSGIAALALTWTAPTDDGGADVVGYRVRYGTTDPPNTAPGAGDCVDADRNADAATLTCLLTGLAHDTAYYVEVYAINESLFESPTDPSAIVSKRTASSLSIEEAPEDPAENDTAFATFTIQAQDQGGALAPAGSATITVRLEPGASFIGEVSGTTSVTTVDGVATFDDIVVTGTADAEFDLIFEATGLDSASSTKTVTPGVATALTITLPDHVRDAGLPFTEPVVLSRVDVSGNPTPLGGDLDVDLAAASLVPEATLHAIANDGVTAVPDPVVTIPTDVATIEVPHLVVAAPATDVTLTATATGLTGSSASFDVHPITFTLTSPLPYVPNDGSTIDLTLTLRGLGDTPRSGAAVVTTPFGTLSRCDDTPLDGGVAQIDVDGIGCVRLTSDDATLLNVVTATCVGTCLTTLDITFAREPDAPTDVIAVPGDQQATVTWTPPAFDGGSPIESYYVTASPGGRTCTYDVGEEPLGCIVTGLTNAVPVTFRVEAISPGGVSVPSLASAPVTPEGAMATFALTVPTEVRYRNIPFEEPLTLTRLDATGQPTRVGGAVSVSLTAVGGSVPGVLRGTEAGTFTVTIPEGASTVLIPNLIHTGAGDGITIQATYETIVGTSEPFPVIDLAFDVSTDLDVIRGEGAFATITIRLTAVDLGGLPNRPIALTIDGADLRTCDGDPAGTTRQTDAAGEICLHLIPDLDERRATFTAACSPACTQTLEIAFATVPETPDLAQAGVVNEDAGGTLTFDPVEDGGAPIETYLIEVGPANRVDTCDAGVADILDALLAPAGIDAGAAAIVLTLDPSTFDVPLGNRVTYCVRVSAVNAMGPSNPSAWVLLTPAIDLDAPSGLAGAPGDTLAWFAFAPVTDAVTYDVSIDGAPWTERGDGETLRSPLTLRDLTNGVPVTVRLRAVDPARGAGPASAPATVTPVAEPIVTPAPVLELVPPEAPPVVGLVDGVGILSFISTITNSGDGPLAQAWLYPAIPEGATLLDLTAVDRGTIFPEGNGRFFWGDLNLLPGETTSFIVRVQLTED